MTKGWDAGTLQDFISDFIVPQRDKPKSFDGNIPWCRIEDIDGKYLSKSKTGKCVSQHLVDSMPLRVFPKGTVIVSCSADLGRCAIVEKPLVTNQTFIGLVPKKTVDAEFLYYSMIFRAEELNSIASGATIKYLAKKKFQSLLYEIPALPEQKRIVAILDQTFAGIDQAVANTKKNLANARELFDNYLNKLFSEMTASELLSIGEIGEVFDGPHATPKTVESGPIFLGIKSLDNGVLDLSKTRHVTPDDFLKWTKRVTPQPGDIVFSYETKLGAAAIIPENLKCCLGRRMALVRLNRERVDPHYFLYQYLSPPFQQYLSERYLRGATVDRISIKEFPSYQVRIPTMKQQIFIVSKIEIINTKSRKLAEVASTKINLLKELKQSILQKAFKGELTADTVLKEAAA